MAYNREFTDELLKRLENSAIHARYKDEIRFYDIIASGNLDEVKRIVSNPGDITKYDNLTYGHLSDDPVQNAKYHVAISTALVTRYCIKNGLDHEVAYTLSDVYIFKMDKMSRMEDIINLHSDMLLDFTRHMAELPKKNIFSLQTAQAMNYVGSHYTEDINVESIAKELGINRSYLSKLFKKNTGISLGEYIRKERVKAAANMLEFSDMSASEIAGLLHFSSQSHFIQCFKKEMGCTPAHYRNTSHPSI
ncbi:MAG: helix-turn-helix transcriptional regulator [Lachnospiraceae bacterium]|nr:helix-turn-helix transcriptional regulator [Lachnospiraceae bacterium]